MQTSVSVTIDTNWDSPCCMFVKMGWERDKSSIALVLHGRATKLFCFFSVIFFIIHTNNIFTFDRVFVFLESCRTASTSETATSLAPWMLHEPFRDRHCECGMRSPDDHNRGVTIEGRRQCLYMPCCKCSMVLMIESLPFMTGWGKQQRRHVINEGYKPSGKARCFLTPSVACSKRFLWWRLWLGRFCVARNFFFTTEIPWL